MYQLKAEDVDVHEHILLYKAGDTRSLDYIIESFGAFITSYVLLIKEGRANMDNMPQKKLIMLFGHAESARKYSKNLVKHITDDFQDMFDQLLDLVKFLFRKYTHEEIRHEIVICLIQMVIRYKHLECPGFRLYIYNCFHYELFRALQALRKDPVAVYDTWGDDRLELVDDPFADVGYALADEQAGYEFSFKKAKGNGEYLIGDRDKSVLSDDILDINWLNGLTCGEEFGKLNPFHREILKMYFIDKMTDTAIAEYFGVVRMSIWRRRIEAVEILSKACGIERKRYA